MPTDYSLLDATAEILIMLLAAFLLGWLFCWLMKKLFGRKPKAISRQTSVDIDKPVMPETRRSGIVSSNRERLYSADADLDLDVDAPDINKPGVNLNEVDLPKSPSIEKPAVDIDTPELNKPRPRIDLPDFNTPEVNIKDKLDAGIGVGKSTLGKGLGAATAGLGAVAVGASAFKDKAVDKVGSLDMSVNTPEVSAPEVELSDADISLPETDINLPEVDKVDFETEIDLPEIDRPSLDTEIDLPEVPEIDTPSVNVNTQTPDIDMPSASLPDLEGAKSAVTGTVEAGKSKLSGLGAAGLGAGAAGMGAIAAGASSLKDSAAEKVGGLSDKLTRPDLPSNPQRSAGAVDGRIDHSQTESDDLTRISGIDTQVVGVLNNQGIHSYKDLQETNRTQLKEYLDATGDSKMRSLEPASWPHQATLCSNRNWSKLSEYQSFLTGSNLDTRQAIPSYEVTEGDDLKKVEGIGPFFESLLNDAGITTYEHLKNSDRDTLKEIIDAAGPDYRMHEPETWPYQAGLAHRGEWKKLQDYIHFMTGRG